MKKIFRMLVMLIALLVFCQSVSFADNALDKFKRGLTNTLTGWIEIFTTIDRHCEERGRIAGFFTGLPAGLGRAVWRTCAGGYETATFFVPLPYHYVPIMEPEFVLDSCSFK